MKIRFCRICGGKIKRILSLGKIPIVNYFLSKEDLKKPEEKYPLNFCICENCGLGQTDEIINPEKIFSTYHYVSSTSLPLKKHLEDLAETCRKRFSLSKRSQVLDKVLIPLPVIKVI